ncbi:MAG: NAD-dependent epimerase/dehydratase family protein [Myxococcota bacterium]
MSFPSIVVTGASGFIGRQLVAALKDDCRIYAIDWLSQEQSEIPSHPNVQWGQADIAERESFLSVFRELVGPDRPELLVHLAAHYNFEGEDPVPYYRTNVDGLRNTLDATVEAKIPRFVFASSLAACRFPSFGEALNEHSPPDGEHIYARTKREGEKMLAEYDDRLRSVIVRFAAIYSDWCEYQPLYAFLQTWLSTRWNHKILAGAGQSAIPYLHIRDAVRFVRTVIAQFDELENREILIASPDGASSHLELYEAATGAYFDTPPRPYFIPRFMVWPGLALRYVFGRIVGDLPFERPWMARYVDAKMTTDASFTRERLGWAPRPRLGIRHRLPFLVENYKAYPIEWERRNLGRLQTPTIRPNLYIHDLLQRHSEDISQRMTQAILQGRGQERFPTYQGVDHREQTWNHRLALNHLLNSIRTRERTLFLDYCTDLARRRFEQGFGIEEVIGALKELERVCLAVFRDDPASEPYTKSFHPHVSTTIRFGIDQVEEMYDRIADSRSRALFSATELPTVPIEDPQSDAHDAIADGSQEDHGGRVQPEP